jgi:hypothetical protein
MKRVFRVGVMAGLLALGIQSQAEAVVILSVRICQGGLLCQDFGPAPGPGPFVNSAISVGDYAVSGSVSSNEDAAGSNAATTTISVKRLTAANAGNLEIWLQATNYNLPSGPAYIFTTTLGATSSLAPSASTVTYQGWVSTTNASGFPPPGSLSPGVITCALGAPTDNCISPELSLVTPSGGNPFSIVTLTTFNVPSVSTAATYTSNAQANITAVPEPASMMLLGTGLAGLAAAVRRRRNKVN